MQQTSAPQELDMPIPKKNMPRTPTLPPEILAIIFDLVNANGGSQSHIDLLCCCLVCRDWYACGLPYVARPQSGGDLETPRYDNETLLRLTKIFRDSQRNGLSLGYNGNRILVEYGNLVCFENSWDANHGLAPNGQPPRAMLDKTRAQIVGQLIWALRTRMTTLALNMHNSTNPARLRIFQDMHTVLASGFRYVTTLRIDLLSLGDRAFDTSLPSNATSSAKASNRLSSFSNSLKRMLPPCGSADADIDDGTDQHPIISLIRYLSPRLERFYLSVSDFTPALSLALRSCPRIHSIWLHSVHFELPPLHLARTIASWPKLHTLSIRTQYTRLSLTATVAVLARSPPPLQVLELHDYAYDDPNPTLAQLITACAPTLVYLGLPRLKTPPHDADRLMTHLAALPLPKLRTLDLNGTAGSFSGRAFRSDGVTNPPHPPLPWPELREIKLDECSSGPSACAANDFVGLAIRSCPKLERVSLPPQARTGPVEAVRMLEKDGFVLSQDRQRGCLFVRGDVVKWEQWGEDVESYEGVMVNM